MTAVASKCDQHWRPDIIRRCLLYVCSENSSTLFQLWTDLRIWRIKFHNQYICNIRMAYTKYILQYCIEHQVMWTLYIVVYKTISVSHYVSHFAFYLYVLLISLASPLSSTTLLSYTNVEPMTTTICIVSTHATGVQMFNMICMFYKCLQPVFVWGINHFWRPNNGYRSMYRM